MSHNIKVAIKVRPLIKREKEENLPIQWIVQENSIVSTDSEVKKRGDGGFCFDHIFGMKASNLEVFDTIVKPIVEATVNGFNGTVFAYGQTSSGKTYTMMGNTQEPGIIPLSINYMFDAIANTAGREFLLRVSYLEIYNEKVNDLLNKSGKDLKLKEDGSGQVILKCKEEITNCPENVLSIMKKGDKNRRIGETNMNERSSRSHTIFRITIESRQAGADSDGAIQVSQLNLVDLAGSERARQTGATGERFKEGRHINMSLSALGLVIMQLSESQDSQKHVNFRDNKLTRLLQNSLGGNTMTAIICAVTPAALEETQCTLGFASRAKSVRNKPQVNEVMSDAALLKRYAKQLSKLQTELSKIKNENRSAEVEEMESKLQEKERINQLLEERIELLKTRIVSGDITTNQESFKSKSKRRQTWGGPSMFNQQLSVFPSTGTLTPIKEISFEKPPRKSIIQSVDIMNQTFQIAFTDFELELFESERDRISEDNASDSEEESLITKHKSRVTFRDDVFTIKSKNSITPEKNTTPEKCNACARSMTYQSPSTPKHVLRKCISNLSKEYKELLEYTTLEKQLLCHENHCCTHEEETERETEFVPEVKGELNRLNLGEGKGIEYIIAELSFKLNETEEQNKLKKEENERLKKQLGELQTQVQNIASERNEFEYMSRELRAQLKTKTTELELKNMTEENIKEPEMEKIAALEQRMESIIQEKEVLERTNAELRSESTKKFTELQRQLDNVTSERNEFEYMHRELSAKLARHSLELEDLKKNPGAVNAEMESVIAERNEYQELNTKLNQRISELESKIELEQKENQNATTRISELENQIKNQADAESVQETVLNQKISELESKIELEQNENQNATTRISELENQIKNQADAESVQETVLNQKISELESKIELEQKENQNATTRISELESQIKNQIDAESVQETVLNQRISELESKIELEKKENQNATTRISELENQIKNQADAKSLQETVLNQKISELESKIELEQKENQNATTRISELENQIKNQADAKSLQETVLNQKISELESKIELEQKENQNATTRISELENQIKNQVDAESVQETVLNQRISELESKIELEQKENQNATTRISELENQIKNQADAKSLQETVLNQKISELESKIELEQKENQNATTRISELENQIKNQADAESVQETVLNQKISELESKIELEKKENQNATTRISELKNQIKNQADAKSLQETVLNQKISELESKIELEQKENQNATTRISELENQIKNQADAKSLQETVLNQKISELESKIELEQKENQNATTRISELENQIKNQVDAESVQETVLNQRISELESKIELEQKENQNATTRISELENQIKNQADAKSLQETVLNQKISELESKIELEQKENQNATTRISELENQIKNQADAESVQETVLNQKISELESKIELEKKENQNATTRISELENQIKNQADAKSLQETVLNQKISELESKIELEQKENQNATTRISELENQIKNQADAKSLQETVLNQKISELESKIELEQKENQNATTRISELESQIKNQIDAESLQKTISMLTTENMAMATKLTTEQENAKQVELDLQKTIDELYERISEVTNQKIILEGDLATCKEQLECIKSRTSEMISQEQLLTTYQSKIDTLTTENIELSASVAEKTKELEEIKESKSLLYDHECIYKEQIAVLTRKNKCLSSENNELSTDLMDKIEENDSLKEQCDMLKNKLQLLTTKDNCLEDNMEHMKSENNVLKTEIIELKAKVAILSNENANFSNNLLETMENFDCLNNDRFSCNTLHLSTIFNNSTNSPNESLQENLQERGETTDQITTLQEKVEHLTRLNEKLSDLKLTSCNRCEHLREMNESRRSLKIEAKTLNQKLEDLQRKFDQKCTNTELLKSQMNEESTSNVQSNSLNVSIVDETNVTLIEEKIQNLNDELQTLIADPEKLSVLDKDKCDEHEQLQQDLVVSENIKQDFVPKGKKNENRIEKIQISIDELRNSINDLKKNNSNFTSMLDKFNCEKANLLNEIGKLKTSREELQKTATEKMRSFENDFTNLNKEIERFLIQEKKQRLTLEVELEGLKAKEQDKSRLVDELHDQISSLKHELELIANEKNELAASAIMERKYKEEFELLKKQYEDLEKANLQSTETEQHSKSRIQELEACIETLQANIVKQECLCKEFEEKSINLEKLLQESEQEKCGLTQKVQTVETDLLQVRNNLETEFKNEFGSMAAQYELRVKESETNLQELNETLNKYVEENLNLKQELVRVENIEKKLNEIVTENEDKEKVLTASNEKLINELNDTRRCIIKELMSLKCDANPTNLSDMSINDIFVILLQALVSKENEIIKTMRDSFEKSRRKLEDEKQQSVDTEKRTILWAKELEVEIEKLQTDLTEREREQEECQKKISQLEHLLAESNHENEILKEKMEAFETDFNNMQVEFDKQCKVDNKQEEAMLVAQRKEREAQEIIKNKEVELESKMKSEKESYGKKMNDLVQTIESYKIKNLELNNTVEGLEMNEKQLKNVLEANSIEMKRKDQNIEKLTTELEQLTEMFNEINRAMEQKNSHIEEIKAVLKTKCDVLFEYKTKCETIMPEYEMMKECIGNQEMTIGRCKKEIEALMREKESELQTVKDALNFEEIKNAGLTKQLNEISNRNMALIDELNKLKENYEELQQTNAKLEKKLRDSTSKIKAKAELDEANELNRQLQNNLEGASNRVVELQEIKNQTLIEMVDLKSKYELALQENAEIKSALTLCKSKLNVSSCQEDKYNALLLEKNKIALELESKKLMLNGKDAELKDCASRIQELTESNKELDSELDEYAAVIRERDNEISNLEEKLHNRLTENTVITEMQQKLRDRYEENEGLQNQVEALKMRLEMERPEDCRPQLEAVIRKMRKENQELRTELSSCKKRLESLPQRNVETKNMLSSNSHSTETELVNDLKTKLRFLEEENMKLKRYVHNHTSSKEESMRKQLKNATFDKKLAEYEEEYQQLKKKIHELELQLVSKNGKIATLEIQIQCENFPYQKKCKELEERLLAFRNKNSELNVEVRRLQKTLNDTNTWECDVCRRWRLNRRDQACQTIPNNAPSFCSSTSGVVEDHVRIQKLEREKMLMRDLCRSRSRRIKELEDRIQELEVQNSADSRPVENSGMR